MQISVLKEGTPVFLLNLKQSGYIVGIIIRNNKASCEVSYFAGVDYRIITVNRFEFTTTSSDNTIQIKFKDAKG